MSQILEESESDEEEIFDSYQLETTEMDRNRSRERVKFITEDSSDDDLLSPDLDYTQEIVLKLRKEKQELRRELTKSRHDLDSIRRLPSPSPEAVSTDEIIVVAEKKEDSMIIESLDEKDPESLKKHIKKLEEQNKTIDYHLSQYFMKYNELRDENERKDKNIREAHDSLKKMREKNNVLSIKYKKASGFRKKNSEKEHEKQKKTNKKDSKRNRENKGNSRERIHEISEEEEEEGEREEDDDEEISSRRRRKRKEVEEEISEEEEEEEIKPSSEKIRQFLKKKSKSSSSDLNPKRIVTHVSSAIPEQIQYHQQREDGGRRTRTKFQHSSYNENRKRKSRLEKKEDKKNKKKKKKNISTTRRRRRRKNEVVDNLQDFGGEDTLYRNGVDNNNKNENDWVVVGKENGSEVEYSQFLQQQHQQLGNEINIQQLQEHGGGDEGGGYSKFHNLLTQQIGIQKNHHTRELQKLEKTYQKRIKQMNLETDSTLSQYRQHIMGLTKKCKAWEGKYHRMSKRFNTFRKELGDKSTELVRKYLLRIKELEERNDLLRMEMSGYQESAGVIKRSKISITSKYKNLRTQMESLKRKYFRAIEKLELHKTTSKRELDTRVNELTREIDILKATSEKTPKQSTSQYGNKQHGHRDSNVGMVYGTMSPQEQQYVQQQTQQLAQVNFQMETELNVTRRDLGERERIIHNLKQELQKTKMMCNNLRRVHAQQKKKTRILEDKYNKMTKKYNEVKKNAEHEIDRSSSSQKQSEEKERKLKDDMEKMKKEVEESKKKYRDFRRKCREYQTRIKDYKRKEKERERRKRKSKSKSKKSGGSSSGESD